MHASGHDVIAAVAVEIAHGDGDAMSRTRVDLPAPELLLAVVFQPHDAGVAAFVPVVEHRDEHDVSVAVGIEVAHRRGVRAAELGDSARHKIPAAEVLEPQASM